MNKSNAIPSSIPSLDDLAHAPIPENTQVRRRTRAEQQRLALDDTCDEQTTAYTVPPELLDKIRTQHGGPSLQRLLDLDRDDDVTLAYDAAPVSDEGTAKPGSPVEATRAPSSAPLPLIRAASAPAEPTPVQVHSADEVTNPGLRKTGEFGARTRGRSGLNRFLLAASGILLLTIGMLLGLLLRP